MSGKSEDTYWKNQVEEFCRIFGLTVDDNSWRYDSNYHHFRNRIVLKYGKSVVSVTSKQYRSGLNQLVVRYESGENREDAYMEMMQKLSGQTLIWRWTEKQTPAPLGFVRNRRERVLKLPEFGSVEELRLKLMASGVEL